MNLIPTTRDPAFNWITRKEHDRVMSELARVDDKLGRAGDDQSLEVRQAILDAWTLLDRYRRECDHHIAKRREQADTIDNKLADLARRLDAQ